MKEILTIGNIENDFRRLGIGIRQTYKSNGIDEYGVCVVNDKEFEILCNESDIENTWLDCGWRYSEGSNQGKPNELTMINGKGIMAWIETFNDEDGNECIPIYNSLLEYFCNHLGASQPKNVCALAVDLAKYNDITLSELFNTYQE